MVLDLYEKLRENANTLFRELSINSQYFEQGLLTVCGGGRLECPPGVVTSI